MFKFQYLFFIHNFLTFLFHYFFPFLLNLFYGIFVALIFYSVYILMETEK